MSSLKNSPYLIIGGTTKAATTSLFYYLTDHPQVCISSLKETRFFIDENYPTKPLSYHWTDGYEQYEKFFLTDSPQIRLRVEVTPDYLYSLGTPQRIKKVLPEAKIFFILREPISRIISWYKFAKQRALIPRKMSFDEYVEQQLDAEGYDPLLQVKQTPAQEGNLILPPSFLSALKHGCYANYLQSYLEVFGRDRVRIAFYEDLCQDPKVVLKNLCHFTDLNAEIYEDYNFQVFNRSETMKNIELDQVYRQLKTNIRKYTHNLPIRPPLRRVRKWFDSIYNPLNTRNPEKVVISTKIKSILQDYYQKENKALETLLGYPPPWG
jgi:hypothetical protein